jgi:hypothetical protein
MNRAGLFQGMQGTKMKRPNKDLEVNQPSNGRPAGMTGAIYGKYYKSPKMFSEVIDYSSRRGVKPCFTITRHVYRTPPIVEASAALRPVGGMSRSQNPSMANTRPLDLPLQIPIGNINGVDNSPLGIPN